MPSSISILILSAIVLCSCNGGMRSAFQRKERVYQPPRLGAEYRFEDGLRRQKHPQNLWSKKERKEMEKMGRYTPKTTDAPSTRISPLQADSLLTGKTRDTTQNTTTAPADTAQRKQEP
ncbi:hypothetical protein [Chitinophaga caseinilytica]|uniref:Secreted protein n=1 Tax=Chitinophaga caseinilytica TaxID=2267521 RepID=A0ABZ2Z463_9BACT